MMECGKENGIRIRYLEGREKIRSLPLWRQCFSEDSPAFVAFYYREKAKDNRILVKMEDHTILTMLHRNPYTIRWKDTRWTADYIVGVATRKDRRHEGHMGEVLTRALQDMNREHRPFAFLMPAAKEIYAPFSFRYVEKQTEVILNPKEEMKLERKPVGKTQEECRRIADWMTQWLEKQYDMCTVREEGYVRQLLAELESEGGQLEWLMDQGVVIGLQAFWGIHGREQRLLYAGDPWCRWGKERPRIMARITDLSAFLPAFCLLEKGRLTVELTVRDAQIPANNGVFVWELSEKGSFVCRAGKERSDPSGERIRLEGDIAQLTEWLFGYRAAAAIWKDSRFSALERIQTVKRPFLDEIV